MSVIIGIDPHKALHAACVIDRSEVELAELQVRTGPRQLAELLAWAAPFECRTWAIESAGGLGYLLAQQLVARGEHVVDVPATLSSRVRVLGSGRSNKNDANDARAVAVAALRSPSIAHVRAEDHVQCAAPVGQGPARRVAGSEPGVLPAARAGARVGAGRDPQGNRCRHKQIRSSATIEPVNATQRQRLELAHETLDEIRLLDAKVEAIQGSHHRSRHRVGDVADRHLRRRSDHRRDDHRLHRRRHPVPDRRALRRVQRDRPDRVLLIRATPCIGCRDAATER